MKTSILLTVCVTVFFLACDQETEELYQSNIQRSMIQADRADVMESNDPLTRDNHCIEIAASHLLYGIGKLEPIREKAFQDKNMENVAQQRYRIEANGSAISELFARGDTEVKLIYDARTYSLTGVITTWFYYGEKLELRLDGNAKVRYDENKMKITAKVIEATLNTDGEEFVLEQGEVSLILPLMPEGQFEVSINANAFLCAH